MYNLDIQDEKVLRERILVSLPNDQTFTHSLFISWNQGLIADRLPTEKVWSYSCENGIPGSVKTTSPNIYNGSIFDISKIVIPRIDLIVITNVLYPKYIGNSKQLIMILLDEILQPEGILVSAHFHEDYHIRFPYMTISREWFLIKNYSFLLEVYVK